MDEIPVAFLGTSLLLHSDSRRSCQHSPKKNKVIDTESSNSKSRPLCRNNPHKKQKKNKQCRQSCQHSSKKNKVIDSESSNSENRPLGRNNPNKKQKKDAKLSPAITRSAWS